MERREFIKKTTATGTFLTGMHLTGMIKPLDDRLKLNPRLGEETDGNSWKLLGGDEIIDNDPQATYKEWDDCLPLLYRGAKRHERNRCFICA